MNKYILTLISRHSIQEVLSNIKVELEVLNLKIIQSKHLNPLFTSDAEFADAYALELQCDAPQIHINSLCKHLNEMFNLDAVIQDKSSARSTKKLACFDMDSTLIQHEVMDELAYKYGIGEKIAAITESAMRGEISFKQSFNQRLACLKGFDASLIPKIAQNLKLTTGAKILIKTLKAHGIKVIILSGGFENFAVHLQSELGDLDDIYANILEIDNGKLTGKISNELVNETRKLTLIKKLAAKYNTTTAHAIAVGDGANDIPMLLEAGLGVAYHAKPIVQEKTQHCINHTDLSAVLYVLGFSQADFIKS